MQLVLERVLVIPKIRKLLKNWYFWLIHFYWMAVFYHRMMLLLISFTMLMTSWLQPMWPWVNTKLRGIRVQTRALFSRRVCNRSYLYGWKKNIFTTHATKLGWYSKNFLLQICCLCTEALNISCVSKWILQTDGKYSYKLSYINKYLNDTNP